MSISRSEDAVQTLSQRMRHACQRTLYGGILEPFFFFPPLDFLCFLGKSSPYCFLTYLPNIWDERGVLGVAIAEGIRPSQGT